MSGSNLCRVSIDVSDLLVKPVEGHDDVFAFRFDFIPEGKAVTDGETAQVVTELEDGDLLLDGYAAVFEGTDRQGENFTDGAFKRGVKSFLDGQASLCYHHDRGLCLGKVLDLREEEGKGLRMKARVDGAVRQHPVLGTIYQQIKKGTLNALSVGGFFRRKLTEAGYRISDMDFTEISVTPVPIHPGTKFAVVAGKALTSDLKADHVKIPEFPEDEIRDEDFMWAQDALSSLDRIFEKLNKRGDGGTDSTAGDNLAVLG